MDGITLDVLIAESRPLVVGRHLGRVALGGPEVLLLEVSGPGRLCVRLDASRPAAGLYLLSREEARALQDPLPEERGGPARHALLHFRKHLEGRRVVALSRVAGERVVTLEAGPALLVLRLGAPAPALTLVLEHAALASLGVGPPAFPHPPPSPGREWDAVDPDALAEAATHGPRAVLALCPSLGPLLARRLAAGIETVTSLREYLAQPRLTVLLPDPFTACSDAQLSEPGAVGLLPFAPDNASAASAVSVPDTAREAARLFLEMRRRGWVFADRRNAVRGGLHREVRRLATLEAHLRDDLAGLPDEATLRRSAEALLAAAPGLLADGESSAEVPDPVDPGRRLRIPVDPALSAPANADRFFAKARRIGRAQEQIQVRLAEVHRALQDARAREAQAVAARSIEDLQAIRTTNRGAVGLMGRDRGAQAGLSASSGPRHYLTSRGLSIRVGRGARENHHLTFAVARPEDFWLHARDVPGAHVILQNAEGRVGAQDLREAAEVAAFFSEARDEKGVDVHVARRKHVRAAAGGPGRVRVGHSETLRVTPRDPEGRLRRR